MKPTVLVVDDDRTVRTGLTLTLSHAGYEVKSAATPDEALTFIRSERADLVLMDMNFGFTTDGQEGIALLRKVKIFRPDLPVILITAWGSIPLAVEGVKYGAFDFITKPWNNQMLLQQVSTAIDISTEKNDSEDSDFDRSAIIGTSKAINDVLDTVKRIAATDASVLITGENGTGKELIAQAIHANSRRKNAPFVKVNLGGIAQSLFESEMFGHAKGAFTGAVGERKGRFELADKGTIFLDEIGDLDINCQVKLLRVLQEHTFERLGESRSRQIDIRVVSATNADLGDMLARHSFREDLYYRINTIVLHLPPLRERREDIPTLIKHFAKSAADNKKDFSPESVDYLCRQPFPGNIRQLKNIVERAILISPDATVELADVEKACQGMPGANAELSNNNLSGRSLDEIEKTAIIKAIENHSGNLSNAAAELGITRQSLYRRMEKYGIRQ